MIFVEKSFLIAKYIAAESADLVRSQILQQSAAQVLRQANQSPQLALQLLKA